MDFKDLKDRLHNTDPRVRVETLRVLAMLEETRALEILSCSFIRMTPMSACATLRSGPGTSSGRPRNAATIPKPPSRNTSNAAHARIWSSWSSMAQYPIPLLTLPSGMMWRWRVPNGKQVDTVKDDDPPDDDTGLLDAGLRGF